MIGIGITMSAPRIPTCVLPIAAGAGVSAVSLAAIDWGQATQRATAAIGLAGLVGGAVVGGIIWAIRKWDDVHFERRKRAEDFDKGSLTAQLEELKEQGAESARVSDENQKAMRVSLHELRNETQLAKAENYQLRLELGTLRTQFMAVSKQLRETDILLHAARNEMHGVTEELQKTRAVLAETERDRNALRQQLDGLNRKQDDQGSRLQALETGSKESFQVPPGLLDAPSQGTPTVIAPKGGKP